MKQNLKENILPIVSLFASLSTLICCALPALFVSLGAGAVIAGLISNVPQLIWLSENKISLFIIAGILLLIAGYFTLSNKNKACPTDPKLALACTRLRKFNSIIFYISLTTYLIGFFFAFIAVYIF